MRHPSGRVAAALTALSCCLALVVTGCANPESEKTAPPAKAADGTQMNLSPSQDRLHAQRIAAIADSVPEAVREDGFLDIVNLAGTEPPLSFYATDNQTVIGVEPDLATLVADVLGLKPRFHTVSWENIFIGLDSGKYELAMTNVTVTEERKDKYDFATYRADEVAFEAPRDADWTVRGPNDVAGRTIAVTAGTNQEQLLRTWDRQNRAKNLDPVTVKNFQNPADYYLALGSGRVDAYLGPGPAGAYHAAASGKTKVIGTFSSSGDGLEGRIGATVRKENGLIEPVAKALNVVMADGTYTEVLKRWGLQAEALPKSEVNPPGIPRS
ncbi:ABC transporter substrate-binding protein [Micromonospora sp. MH99]|uniref:ABC transporter substrate-binding protein n=1 Tax=Micromonospora sp. MH99 TaxID=1945510 RepID=UPI001F3DB6FC|nr:ABC transporter substrate-binding protein [Micromonospora sp. MH99]MCF0091243.1 L-cystine-binding protein FliY [Micromonospora sp. MH99]